MKIQEIKTDLFTRTTLTDYGVRFEHIDKEKAEKENCPIGMMFHYAITIHVLKTGGINVNSFRHVHITDDQLMEVVRVSEIIKGE